MLLPTLPTLTITAIYYFWLCYQREIMRQQQAQPTKSKSRIIRERVAYMLWQAANQMKA